MGSKHFKKEINFIMGNDSNKELKDIETPEEVYVLLAIRRKKDNEGQHDEKVIRQVAYNFEDDYRILKERTKRFAGTWRIYRSVNKRDLKKAQVDFIMSQVEALMKGEKIRILESAWKSRLMQGQNKSEKLFLIDIDTVYEQVWEDVVAFLEDHTEIHEQIKTPNGYHVVCRGFDIRPLQAEFDEKVVSVKKDALLFQEIYDVELSL